MSRKIAITLAAAAVALCGAVAVWRGSALSDARSEFRLAVDLEHPVETVWAALTQKSLVDKYYVVPLRADVGGVGSEIAYGPPTAKLISGVVLEHDAPRKLVHSFRFQGDTASPDTIVTYRLAATATGTRLEIRHTGYPVGSQGYADIAGGWPVIANGLKSILDGRR